ncbi:MAG: helix-turn-helix domain-containing protein [Prevotella sp.]|nr:helix-turn-helix domain-containing protein [Prevotella sp.]
MNRKALLTFFILSISVSAYSQMGKLFDANQQLSSSFTSQVYLDNDGFIWSATRNGLNKYDGYQFRILKKEKAQQTGMASNYVNCIIQDRKGLFYMGMWGALQTYDGNKFQDVTVRSLDGQDVTCYVTCFVERQNGEIWAGTSGFGVLRFDDPQHAHQMGGVLKNIHTVNHLMEDDHGGLWVIDRDGGAIHIDGNTTHEYFYEAPIKSYLSKLCKDDKGNIYIGTKGFGLYRITNGQVVKVEGTDGKQISTLYFSKQGQLIIGYDGEGVGIYDPTTGALTDNPYYSQEVDLSKSKVLSITEDRSGNLWLGLLQKGLYMQPGTPMGFHYMGYKLGPRNKISSACVISTFIDSHGRIWIGTDKDGLYSFDSNFNLLKHYKDYFPASIMTIREDLNGRIWIGSYREGGGWIDPTNKQYHNYNFGLSNGLSIFDIDVDKNNNLWIATMGNGLVKLDQNTGKLKSYLMNEGAPTNPKINSITNDYISQISLSPDNKRIYVATTMGVCCLDIATENWTSVFGKNCLNYGTPVRIAREYSGQLWIGSNDGLYAYDLQNKELKLYTTEKGLADNGIASIEQDKQGKLWVATDHGLCCLDLKTGQTRNFFIDNGLQSNEFSDGASWSTPTGIMLFGGVGGITWFDPSEIQQAKWDATVELTAFSVNGEQVNSLTRSGIYQVTDTAVIASHRFDLSHNDNSFTIQLSTLTYDNPEHITYMYGINNEPFVRLQPGVNEITFSHLSPGTYHFKVKAERNNIETPEREFTIIVHSPWYRTWWAYLLYLAALFTAIYLYLANRRRKEQDRLKLQEHIHAEEMGEAKLRFFMNISHEIRTPMTLILTPLLTLMKEDHDPQRQGIYETIKRNAERILSLVNQIMDLRKIDKGMMQMRMQETDLVAFVKDIHSLFNQQANAKSISLNYEHDSKELPVWVDRKHFDKVIVNILSNAFKFTPAGGEIDIRLTHDEHNATIAIRDNGEKIPEDKIDKIFERFYQTPSTTNDRNTGTGIGLDLARSLVELHYGAISAHNLDKGCEFVVSIPLGNAHLKPDEIITENEEGTPEMVDFNEPEEMMTIDEPKEKQPNEKLTVVIAEDDDEIRDYLKTELSQDYDIHDCSNGRDALAEVYSCNPDIVVSDIMMPEMDGNMLCTKLKANPTTNHIPIILLTAKNRDEDKLEGLEVGADAYIVKPFNMDILRRTIINLINERRLLKQKYGKTEQLEEQISEVKMKSPDEKLLERVMKTINKHLNNSDLCVDMIAEEVGISRVHLHRKMKELTGQTPHDFIRNIRLKQAATLLATKNMNITEVVYACGFSNAASFSTMFKNVYGMSPREYMRNHANKR